MNELGQEVNATSRLFGAMGGNQMVLAELRKETRGLVDDLSLMRGAGDFMNLGITNSMNETARLIGMIEAVKKPTESTEEALNNFGLMMANQSVLRLDSFGLSSSRVKDRIEELKDSLNMSSEAAFTRAVLEELEGKVTSLGDAAFASESNLLRLQNRITNFGQAAAAETERAIATGAYGAWGAAVKQIQKLQADYPNAQEQYTRTQAKAQFYHEQIIEMVALAFRANNGDTAAQTKLAQTMLGYLPEVVEKYPELQSLVLPNQPIQ